MPRYNTSFELDVEDIALIERALITHKSELSLRRLELDAADAGRTASPEDDLESGLEDRLARLEDLLGRLHNQKVWYRPTTTDGAPYIGG